MPHARSPRRIRLSGGGARGELHGSGREVEGVVVPLERLDPAREGPEHRVGGPVVVQVDREPADFGLGGRADPRSSRASHELRAEADADRRHARLQSPLDERHLIREPRVLGVLVRVHRPAEDHDRVPAPRVVGRRVAFGDDPAVEVVASLDDRALEQPAAARGGGVVDDGEDAHRATVSAASPVPVRKPGCLTPFAPRRATGPRESPAIPGRSSTASMTDVEKVSDTDFCQEGRSGRVRSRHRRRSRRQNSVSSVGGGSTAPDAGTPASSSRPRRICALRGAKSSRLLLNIA